jgi:hypothetical protein
MDSRDHLVGPLDPMQHGIAEHSVEFLAIGQSLRVNDISHQAKCASRSINAALESTATTSHLVDLTIANQSSPTGERSRKERSAVSAGAPLF